RRRAATWAAARPRARRAGRGGGRSNSEAGLAGLAGEPLDGITDGLTVRLILERVGPDAVGFVLLAQHPQYLAQVGGHFVIGVEREGAIEIAARFLVEAQAVLHPAEAVDDGGVVRRQF